MIRFLLSVPDDLHRNLRTAAKVRGQTLNGLLREILWEWAEKKNAPR